MTTLAINTHGTASDTQASNLITLEATAAAAREAYRLAVVAYTYQHTPEAEARKAQARTAMNEACTAYRQAYRQWERAERSEYADRAELNYPNFL